MIGRYFHGNREAKAVMARRTKRLIYLTVEEEIIVKKVQHRMRGDCEKSVGE